MVRRRGPQARDAACRRLRRRGQSGVGMVEFALIAPVFFLLLLGQMIIGIVVLNDVELSNGVRDGARAGAICGTQLFVSGTAARLPNGATCSIANVQAYVQSRISTIPGVTPSVSVDFSGNNAGNVPTTCQPGQKVAVTASYAQPMFVPMVGIFFGDPGNTSIRTITANAEATCEQ